MEGRTENDSATYADSGKWQTGNPCLDFFFHVVVIHGARGQSSRRGLLLLRHRTSLHLPRAHASLRLHLRGLRFPTRRAAAAAAAIAVEPMSLML
uniref:Uncharacterized protein n=1 Tax=Oryza meridionalis TaxID=40149 RepID=A0A0E0F318_9ORYZ